MPMVLLIGIIVGFVGLVILGMLVADPEPYLDPPPTGAEEPYTYGDDAYLDALWDSCDATSGDACDDLYFDSPVGSDYEDFGATCGGVESDRSFAGDCG